MVKSDIFKLEQQLENRRAEASDLATAFDNTCTNLKESADSQWEEIEKAYSPGASS